MSATNSMSGTDSIICGACQQQVPVQPGLEQAAMRAHDAVCSARVNRPLPLPTFMEPVQGKSKTMRAPREPREPREHKAKSRVQRAATEFLQSDEAYELGKLLGKVLFRLITKK